MKLKDIEIGKRYKNLTVIGTHKHGRKNMTVLDCRCEVCGKTITVQPVQIGKQNSCIICENHSRYEDLKGLRFGHIIVLDQVGYENGQLKWECQCDCGKKFTMLGKYIKKRAKYHPDLLSCGCVYREKRKADSLEAKLCASNGEYRIWQNLKWRCNNPHAANYANYGGRGIKVCDRWQGERGFENFIADMGERPGKEYSIDRIDNNSDYCPENCRWATSKEQCNNRRNNTVIMFRGARCTVSQLCRKFGLSKNNIYNALGMGVDINYIILKQLGINEARLINHNRIVSEEVTKLLEEKQ